METAMEDVHTTASTPSTMSTSTTGDPRPSWSEDEGGFPAQMGSGRRDARVVCETFTGRDFMGGKASDSRRVHSGSADVRKSAKHLKRRGFAYSHSRNPLLACFIGESVLSSRAIRLNPNCDSANAQRAFFSLIPVDNSRVNERTGEPSSPQLSCIGQVKCRQAKPPRGAGAVIDDLAQLDLTSERKEVSGAAAAAAAAGPGFGRFGARRVSRRATSFDLAAAADIPPLDLNERAECPRLMRSVKRPGGIDVLGSRKVGENEKPQQQQQSAGSPMSLTVAKHSIQHFNHLIKQLLGASMIRTGFICGWNSSSRDSTTQGSDGCGADDDDDGDDDEGEGDDDDEGREAAAEHYEIDLSRFASCDMQAKTPSFRESRYQVGKKLADIRVHSHHQQASQAAAAAAASAHEDDSPDVPNYDDPLQFGRTDHPTIVIKVERRKPSSEATLWKRRCMDRPLSLDVKR